MRNLLLAAAALAALSACSTPAVTDVKPVQKLTHAATADTGDTFSARGQYAQAAAAYRSALAANPEDAAARYGLGEALRKQGKPDLARAEYLKLADNADWRARALEGLGKSSLALGDRAGALETLNEAVAADPAAWRAFLAIAQIHDLAQDWTKADEAYALALASAKEPALVYNNHGVSKLARADAAGAIILFRSALAADPKYQRAQTNLELAEGVAGKSIPAIRASTQDAKERARKLNNYGYVAMLQDRPEEARALYDAAIAEHPSFYPKAYQNLKTLDAAKPAN